MADHNDTDPPRPVPCQYPLSGDHTGVPEVDLDPDPGAAMRRMRVDETGTVHVPPPPGVCPPQPAERCLPSGYRALRDEAALVLPRPIPDPDGPTEE